MAQNDGREVPISIRSAIIAIHSQNNTPFAEIGRIDGIGLYSRTYSKI